MAIWKPRCLFFVWAGVTNLSIAISSPCFQLAVWAAVTNLYPFFPSLPPSSCLASFSLFGPHGLKHRVHDVYDAVGGRHVDVDDVGRARRAGDDDPTGQVKVVGRLGRQGDCLALAGDEGRGAGRQEVAGDPPARHVPQQEGPQGRRVAQQGLQKTRRERGAERAGGRRMSAGHKY